jgi:NADH-quinone oxidoreductase subunit L
MHEETSSEYARYFSYLNLFAAFMLVLVLGANFLVMFVGWEGVGLCSYLLIGFWYRKKSASDAGKKAFIVNRIGDFGFILGVLAIFSAFPTLDFQQIASAAAAVGPETAFGPVSLITLLLFVGATGKSAQIPLYVWLPDAMEGPTPVSALIHAATMVTAGVYMIGRNAVLFSHAPQTLAIVAVIGTCDRLHGRARSAWCRTTSSVCSRTRPSRSSATCSWRWASARSVPASFISTRTRSSRRCCSWARAR